MLVTFMLSPRIQIDFQIRTILQTPRQVNYLLDQSTSQLTLIIESTIFDFDRYDCHKYIAC